MDSVGRAQPPSEISDQQVIDLLNISREVFWENLHIKEYNKNTSENEEHNELQSWPR